MAGRTRQNFTTYQGVGISQTWTYEGADYSGSTVTFAASDPDGDITVSGSAAYDGTDTTITVTFSAAFLTGETVRERAYQLHLSSPGVVATGIWTHLDSYAD